MMENKEIKALIFDWGDTIMRDFPEKEGPMYLWDKVEWIPGAEKTLKKLFGKYILVIATNAGASGTKEMIKALERVGADNYFSHFFSSKELGFEKPDVRFFSSIAKKIGVQPENCIMIGNLYEKDIVGAKASGMKTILFNKARLTHVFPQADKVIYEMGELSSVMIDNLFLP